MANEISMLVPDKMKERERERERERCITGKYWTLFFSSTGPPI
jgi:hypothetical protein